MSNDELTRLRTALAAAEAKYAIWVAAYERKSGEYVLLERDRDALAAQLAVMSEAMKIWVAKCEANEPSYDGTTRGDRFEVHCTLGELRASRDALKSLPLSATALLEERKMALDAVRLLEAAEAFHANCEDCNENENHVPEQCEFCFPYFDAARVKRREVVEALRRCGGKH